MQLMPRLIPRQFGWKLPVGTVRLQFDRQDSFTLAIMKPFSPIRAGQRREALMTVRTQFPTYVPMTAENADITVVGGAGHVGIPLVLALAEAGLCVNVNDVNSAGLDMLQAGCLPFTESGAEVVL